MEETRLLTQVSTLHELIGPSQPDVNNNDSTLITSITILPWNTSSNDTSNHSHHQDDAYYDYYYEYFDWHRSSVVPMTFYLILYDLVAFLGIIGNVILVESIRSHPPLCSLPYSVYFSFLAVSDTAVILVRFLEVNLDRFDNIFQRMLTWNVLVCQVFFLVEYTVSLLSPWLVVLLTLDRFLAVTTPLKWKTIRTRKRAFFACTALAILSFLIYLSSIFFIVDLVPDEFDPDKLYCSSAQASRLLVNVLILGLKSVMPCVLIAVLNVLTLLRIQTQARKRGNLTSTAEARVGKVGGSLANPRDRQKPNPGHDVSVTSSSDDVGSGFSGTVWPEISSSVMAEAGQTGCAGGRDSGHSARGGQSTSGQIGVWETNGADDESRPTAVSFQPSLASGEGRSAIPQTPTRTSNKRGEESSSPPEAKAAGTKREPTHRRQATKKEHSKPTGGSHSQAKSSATISLTYISISAFLSLAPHAIIHTLFMAFLDQYDRRLEENPLAPVPQNLQNLVRVWDIFDLVLLLNFSQNFYILLLTNRYVAQASSKVFRRCLCCLSTGKKKESVYTK